MALCKLLLQKPDLLLLDEPTNHLDADSIVWLRDYLKTFEGGLLMISHDLSVLASACERIAVALTNATATALRRPLSSRSVS